MSVSEEIAKVNAFFKAGEFGPAIEALTVAVALEPDTKGAPINRAVCS
jgi:hypothetical protein